MSDTLTKAQMNRRTLLKQAGIFGLGLPAAAMLVNACGTDDNPDTNRTVNTGGLVVTPPAASPAADHGHGQPAAATTELTMTAQDLKFTPTTLNATAGQLVRLTFVNKGAIEHDWYAEGMPVDGLTAVEQPANFSARMAGIWDTASAAGNPYAGAGASEQMVVEFTPSEAGEFTFICAVPGHAQAGMTGTFTVSAAGETAAAPPASTEVDADEMDRMHEAGVTAFPAPTEGLGGQPLEYTMDGDVKVFDLTCSVIEWEVEPGKKYEAWAYNGVVPGPEIRVTEGDKVRINVTNTLPQSTGVHWHGLIVPNNMDGVPFLTQPPIKPGQTFTYEYQIREGNAGSHMYHSHHNAAFQVTMGLLGAFIVEPKDPSTRPAFDREYTLILNDGPLGGFTINGKGFPATQPLTAKQGEKILIRYMNEGLMIHPMHLHGMPQLVIAKDGWLQPQPWMCDTLNIAPGERWEVLVDATEVGLWAFHCHILSHAESEHGMFGMVTALIVEE
jgi:FtsP/CotA-like multicopper oxidase with cupredoxin domain